MSTINMFQTLHMVDTVYHITANVYHVTYSVHNMIELVRHYDMATKMVLQP